MVLSTATYDAYNDWGGPSLYTGGTQVSSERPLAPGFLVKPEPHRRKMQPLPDREGLWYFEWAERLGLSVWSGGAGWWNWERPVLRWAERSGFAVDIAISTDLDARPDLLQDRRLLVSVGHDEYWSWGMRDRLDAFTAVLPAREKYSKIVGLWQTDAGQPNEVCHIWAYPDLNARAEARGNAMKDPAWQEFLGKGPGFPEEMHSTIMLPAPHSPLK